MIALDTSVVVRYLVGSPPAQAERARALIDGPDDLALPLVTLVETAHVLRSVYSAPGPAIVDALLDLVQRDDVAVLGMATSVVVDSLVAARSNPGRPIPDTLLVGAARAAGALPVATFDRGMRRYGVAMVEP